MHLEPTAHAFLTQNLLSLLVHNYIHKIVNYESLFEDDIVETGNVKTLTNRLGRPQQTVSSQQQ